MDMQEALFERFTISLTVKDAQAVHHSGDCYPDVCVAVTISYIASQLDEIGPEAIRAELVEYGAWDEEELKNDDDNRERIVWIVGGNICEEL